MFSNGSETGSGKTELIKTKIIFFNIDIESLCVLCGFMSSPLFLTLPFAGHIPAVREPVSLTMNATRSMSRRQSRSGDRPHRTDSRRALSRNRSAKLWTTQRRNLRKLGPGPACFFVKKRGLRAVKYSQYSSLLRTHMKPIISIRIARPLRIFQRHLFAE